MKKEDIIKIIYNAYQDRESDNNSKSEKIFQNLRNIENNLIATLSNEQQQQYIDAQLMLEQYHEALEYELVQYVVDYCASINNLLK